VKLVHLVGFIIKKCGQVYTQHVNFQHFMFCCLDYINCGTIVVSRDNYRYYYYYYY
jgi:hypothetical protein